MIKKKKIFLIIIIFLFTYDLESKIIIVKKVNNQIITNLDIEIEKKYLKTLNPKTKNLNPVKFSKIAEDSLVNEKIKEIELNKFFVIDYKDLPRDVFISFIKNFNMSNEEEFNKFLKSKSLDIEMVKKKIYMEFLWNSLIYNKYAGSIKVDKNKIRKKVIEMSKKDKEKIFLLYELIYNINDTKEFKNKTSKITKSITDIGFESTVSIYSISETSKLGGKVGWVNETQISDTISKKLKKLNKGQITEPIKTMNGYMLLYVKDLKFSEKKINIEKEIENMSNFEINEKLKNFSVLHFNKVKINQKIN